MRTVHHSPECTVSVPDSVPAGTEFAVTIFLDGNRVGEMIVGADMLEGEWNLYHMSPLVPDWVFAQWLGDCYPPAGNTIDPERFTFNVPRYNIHFCE